jgi:hypothetical protein
MDGIICPVDNNYGKLPSLLDDISSSMQEAGCCLMLPLVVESSIAVDNLANNHQEWFTFSNGNVDELLGSRPPTYIKQMKHRRTTWSDCPALYQYWCCRCGCGYKLTLCISTVGGVKEVCYKEVEVRVSI